MIAGLMLVTNQENMNKIKNIEKFEADPKNGYKIHDVIREGRAVEIAPLNLSAVIQELQDKMNEVVDAVNQLTP